MKEKIIQTGAEAIIIKKEEAREIELASQVEFVGARSARSSRAVVLKRRVKKGYRFPELDEKIRKLRTRSEAKLLEKAAKLIPTPKLLKIDEKKKEIDMEFLKGRKLSECLDNFPEAEKICVQIGENIAKLHDADIIHGDLTTSNMILVDEKEIDNREIAQTSSSKFNETCSARPSRLPSFKVYFIDYGLGFGNGKIEDKAVDLHLIKQALEAKHFENWKKFFAEILRGYEISKNFKKVMAQFEKVEKRGRYKNQY